MIPKGRGWALARGVPSGVPSGLTVISLGTSFPEAQRRSSTLTKGGSMRRVPYSVLLVLSLALTVLRPSGVHAGDGVAVIIEIRPNAGQVQVRRANETVWRAAEPLLTLRPGDQVNVLRDARVTLAFIGSRGTRVLGAADSPFVVISDAPRNPSHKARETVGKIVEFLIGARREPAHIPISVRPGPSMRVAILSPRDTRLLPGPVNFEWTGSQSVRYRIRVIGPEGGVWEASELTRGQASYPPGGPPLLSGVRYHWQLEAPDVATQQAYFEVLSADQAEQVRTALDELSSQEISDGLRSTAAVLRGSFLIQQGLYSDARKELTAALVTDPSESTLHFLLGLLYDRMGLTDMAGREFLEARDLVNRGQ